MTPHKHAALIKAWADGAEIQVKHNACGWVDNQCPTWNETNEYRIKPKMIKYRLYLTVFDTVQTWHNQHKHPSYLFVKWLGDWQEVVVD